MGNETLQVGERAKCEVVVSFVTSGHDDFDIGDLF